MFCVCGSQSIFMGDVIHITDVISLYSYVAYYFSEHKICSCRVTTFMGMGTTNFKVNSKTDF